MMLPQEVIAGVLFGMCGCLVAISICCFIGYVIECRKRLPDWPQDRVDKSK